MKHPTGRKARRACAKQAKQYQQQVKLWKANGAETRAMMYQADRNHKAAVIAAARTAINFANLMGEDW